MILVDTSVWVDYFTGVESRETNLLDELISHRPILIGDLILTEVLQGFRSDREYQKVRALFSHLVQVNLAGIEIANKSAENYRKLRKKGITVRKTIDMIIATFCIENKIELLHSDRDFKPIEKYLELAVL